MGAEGPVCAKGGMVFGVPRVHRDGHGQEKSAWGVKATVAGRQGTDRSLWSCHVGCVGGIGEPRKGLKKGRDMIKSGFTGEWVMP